MMKTIGIHRNPPNKTFLNTIFGGFVYSLGTPTKCRPTNFAKLVMQGSMGSGWNKYLR